MAIRKHGVGEVIPDEESAQHTAAQQDWDEDDEEGLQEESAK